MAWCICLISNCPAIWAAVEAHCFHDCDAQIGAYSITASADAPNTLGMCLAPPALSVHQPGPLHAAPAACTGPSLGGSHAAAAARTAPSTSQAYP